MRRAQNRKVGLALAVAIATGALLVAGSAPALSQSSAVAWQRTDLKPISQPVALAGKFIFYDATDHHQLRITAVDAATGQTVWSVLSSNSSLRDVASPTLSVVGTTLYGLVGDAATPHAAAVAAIDPATGNVLWQSEPGSFTYTPLSCPGDASTICIAALATSSGPAPPLPPGALRGSGLQIDRFDAKTGLALVPIPLDYGGGQFQQITDGLFSAGDALFVADAGGTRWHVSMTKVFGRGTTADNAGWNINRLDDFGLYVGTIPNRPIKTGRLLAKFDVGKVATAGFSIKTGRVAWRDPGSFYECGILPCPGASQSGYAGPGQPYPTAGLRLREKGILTLTVRPKYKMTASAHANAHIEGFDLKTGRTTWSFNAGRAVGLMGRTRIPAQSGLNSILLKNASGQYVELDLSTGHHSLRSPTAQGWCRGLLEYMTDEVKPKDYIGAPSFYPCLATGQRVATPAVVPSWVGEIGAESNGVIAWADTTGLVAAPG